MSLHTPTHVQYTMYVCVIIILVFASAQTLYFADSHTAQIGRVLTDGSDYQTLHTSSQSADPFGIVKVVSSSDVATLRVHKHCHASHNTQEMREP